MRKNFGAKAMCYPMPVFIIGTYNADGTPNAMNAAWGGISEETEITVCVDSEHKTAENLLARKAFTVSMATAKYMAACDYVGIVSGNKVPDKFAKAGFHATKSEFVDAPLIDELPMALECQVISYDTETCRLVGQVRPSGGGRAEGASDPARHPHREEGLCPCRKLPQAQESCLFAGCGKGFEGQGRRFCAVSDRRRRPAARY